MWMNTFPTETYGTRGMYFDQRLVTAAPETAHPHCCYSRTIIFYKRPWQPLPDGSYARWDQIQTEWDLLGQRWTDADIGWAALAPFVQHEGQVYELSGGSVLWRDGWIMRWLGWRVPEDDRRLVVMREQM